MRRDVGKLGTAAQVEEERPEERPLEAHEGRGGDQRAVLRLARPAGGEPADVENPYLDAGAGSEPESLTGPEHRAGVEAADRQGEVSAPR